MCSDLPAELLCEGETTYQIIADRACRARRRRITVKPLSVWYFGRRMQNPFILGLSTRMAVGGRLEGLTYRPRSVSSLLILLSAMLQAVYWVQSGS